MGKGFTYASYAKETQAVAELAKVFTGSMLESTYIISLFYYIFSVFSVKTQVNFVFFFISHGSYDPPHNELPPPLNASIKWSPLYDPVCINPCLCPTCDGHRFV